MCCSSIIQNSFYRSFFYKSVFIIVKLIIYCLIRSSPVELVIGRTTGATHKLRLSFSKLRFSCPKIMINCLIKDLSTILAVYGAINCTISTMYGTRNSDFLVISGPINCSILVIFVFRSESDSGSRNLQNGSEIAYCLFNGIVLLFLTWFMQAVHLF